jgi:hypothetical protein
MSHMSEKLKTFRTSRVHIDVSNTAPMQHFPDVMVHWYSPFWRPLDREKGPEFKHSGMQVKFLPDPLLMSLTWGWQRFVRLCLLVCFHKIKMKMQRFPC